jgi:hypothetical protein
MLVRVARDDPTATKAYAWDDALLQHRVDGQSANVQSARDLFDGHTTGALFLDGVGTCQEISHRERSSQDCRQTCHRQTFASLPDHWEGCSLLPCLSIEPE